MQLGWGPQRRRWLASEARARLQPRARWLCRARPAAGVVGSSPRQARTNSTWRHLAGRSAGAPPETPNQNISLGYLYELICLVGVLGDVIGVHGWWPVRMRPSTPSTRTVTATSTYRSSGISSPSLSPGPSDVHKPSPPSAPAFSSYPCPVTLLPCRVGQNKQLPEVSCHHP